MCVSGGFCIGEMMRFREIVSVETIVDDATGKRYIGLVDSAFIDLVNELAEENEQLKYTLGAYKVDLNNYKGKCSALEKENEQLKEQLKSIEDGFEFSCTEKIGHFDKDKLIVNDTHTKIHLDGRNLFIKVYIPQTDEFYHFNYTITGKSLMREFIENYNPKGDVE